jgi:hypothetical protein
VQPGLALPRGHDRNELLVALAAEEARHGADDDGVGLDAPGLAARGATLCGSGANHSISMPEYTVSSLSRGATPAATLWSIIASATVTIAWCARRVYRSSQA